MFCRTNRIKDKLNTVSFY